MFEQIEKFPVGRFHYKLLFIAGLGWAFDSMDTGIIAFILPQLTKAWGLTTSQVGLLGSIGIIGMAVGAVLFGTLADRLGRRLVFSATVVIYSIATGLCALAPTYEILLLCRFFVGVGLGGELPVAATLITEYIPSHVRGRFLVLLESFWAIGWLLAAFIAYLIVPLFGWRIAFALGALPALYTFVIRRHLPESIRYYLSHGEIEKAQHTLNKLEAQLGLPLSSPEQTTTTLSINQVESQNPLLLWKKTLVARTTMLWITWFGIVFSYYGIFMWLPSLVYQQGFSIVKTSEYVLWMTLAQLPGYFAAAYLVEKIGRKFTLALFLLGSGVASYFFGNSQSTFDVLLFGSLMSFFNLGAWGTIYAYTPELYPTHIRGLGCGWAAGIGRLGGMVAPMLVGILLTGGWSVTSIFIMFASVFIFVSIVIILLGKESKKQVLEDITY